LNLAYLSNLLRDSDAPFREHNSLLKDSRSSTVAEINLKIAGKSRPVIVKRFRVMSRWDGPASLFRPTACLRSWINGHAFRDCLLPTPRPLAVWHRQILGANLEGYLFVEKAENACDLHQFLTALVPMPPSERQKLLHDVVERLAHSIRELHRRGW